MMVWLALLFSIIFLSMVFYVVMLSFNRALKKYEDNFKGYAQKTLAEVFLFFDPVQLWSLAFLLCVLCIALAWLLTGNLIFSLLVGVFFLVLPPWLLRVVKRKRLVMFDKQLPDMLLSLSGALRAGSGVQNAIKHLVQESPTPLSQELGLVQKEQRLGLSFDEALNNLLRRMPSESTQLVVSSLQIAAQTGGNLAEALERISSTLREIIQMQGRIKALTSQGKMQAWVMSLLPIGLLFVLNKLDPEAMTYLWDTTTGWIVLGVMVILEIGGIWFIKKIVSIDV